MAHVVHIEAKRQAENHVVETIRRALLAAPRDEVTAADAAALTGLPLDRCADALQQLCIRFPSALAVTADGTLRYRFDSLLRRRCSFAAALIRLWGRLRGPAMSILTYWIAPLLLAVVAANMTGLLLFLHRLPWWLEIPIDVVLAVPWFLVFTGALLGLVLFVVFPALALLCATTAVMLPLGALFFEDSPHTWSGKLTLFAVLLGLCCLLLWGLIHIVFRSVVWGMLKAVVKPSEVEGVRGFWRRIDEMLLGPRQQADALLDERRLVAFIRDRGGVVCDAELMGLFGWTRRQAAAESARILADYGGDVLVADSGAVSYDFSPLLGTARTAPDADLRPAWERESCELPPLFGQQGAVAAWAYAVAGLGVLGLVLHPALRLAPGLASYTRHDGLGLLQGLGLWTYLPLLLPLLRLPLRPLRRRELRRRRRFLELLRHALVSPGSPRPVARDELAAVAELEGELDAHGSGGALFPALARELDAAAALRASRPATARPEIIYATEDRKDDGQGNAQPADLPGTDPSDHRPGGHRPLRRRGAVPRPRR